MIGSLARHARLDQRTGETSGKINGPVPGSGATNAMARFKPAQSSGALLCQADCFNVFHFSIGESELFDHQILFHMRLVRRSRERQHAELLVSHEDEVHGEMSMTGSPRARIG